jgi:hypothetical protein
MNNLLSKILLTLLSTVTVSTISLSAAPTVQLQDLLVDQKPDIVFNPGDLILNPDLLLTPTVVVPNNFSAGDVARAADVNQNFAALETAINNTTSGFDWTQVAHLVPIPIEGNTEIAKVIINAPSDGFVVADFAGQAKCASHTYHLWISDLKPDGANDLMVLRLPYSCNGNLHTPVEKNIFEVKEGINTFYLVGYVGGVTKVNLQILGQFVARFYSRRY